MLNIFSRYSRTKLLAIFVIGLMAVFIVRLFYLQVIRHDYYKSQAAVSQTRQWVLPAERGEVYIMNGTNPVKVAMNETVYTVWADPKVTEKPDTVIEVLRRVAGGNLRENARDLLNKKESRYQVLAKNVTYRQAQMIKKEKLYGVGFEKGERRVYPEGQLASQVLGFVDADGKGRYGLEAALEKDLMGKNGMLKSVADVRDVPLTIGNDNINIPAQNGKNIVLSLDRNIQTKVETVLQDRLKSFGAEHGSVIVLNPRDGKVMAMANFPTFNPGELSQVKNVGAFNNNVISYPYEVGSDLKTFTVAAGIDTGTITLDDTYNNTDRVKVDDRTIANLTKGQTGNITFQHALNWSLNTGMVEIVRRMGGEQTINRKGRDILYTYFHDKLGLGKLTGIELAGESPGVVISPANEQGNAVRYSNMSFGQGLDVTMVQVSAGFAALINGGTYYEPSVIQGYMNNGVLQNDASKKAIPGVIKPTTSEQMRIAVEKARTAFYAKDDKKGYTIGGKTGTSQTAKNGVYVDGESIGTYLGFGGEKGELPRYVIMVKVQGDGKEFSGGTHAMPIFTDISNWMIDYLKLKPKG